MERRVETFDIEGFLLTTVFFSFDLLLYLYVLFVSGDCDVMYNDLDVGVVAYHREKRPSFPGHLTHSQNRPLA